MLREYIAQLTEYMGECGICIDPCPKVVIKKGPQQGPEHLINTGWYDPEKQTIALYVHGRHIKDVLRSYAHELIHHDQNMRGLMTPDVMSEMGDGYAQSSKHLRKLEQEAYLKGNMLFRDWTDSLKSR